ncbi:MAG: ATP-binding cassette domain-containing protein [Candidatus Methylacidiphilales bacterium]
MSLIQLKNVTLAYGAHPLLSGADLTIEAGERVCLLGRNGAGKTSLMRLLTGEEQPNSGEITMNPDLRMARLDQEVPRDWQGTVLDVVEAGAQHIGHEEDWQRDVRIDTLLETMKLPPSEMFSSLSGGLKRRVLLARALAGHPDLLLLDEPTNHLDLDSILWMEETLLSLEVTLLFVTHDRTFLRRVANRIVELDRGKLTGWPCDYDTFLVRKAAAMEAEEKQWAAFDKKLAQEEAWIRQGVKARRTRNEGRVRALKALRIERGERRERTGTVKMGVQEGARSGQKVIELRDLSFVYPGESQPVIKELTTTIWKGDKIGIIGPNGSGKTTLLKCMLGGLTPTSGTVQHGTNLEVVYLDQLRDQIDNEKTLAQNVAGNSDTVTFQGRARNIHSYLQDFLFPPDKVRMPAKRLSGGERNRLLLARLFLQPANVLVLDEPTNDLDAETLELLEELLVGFQGTLLLVSHDRAFLDNVVTSTLVFEGEGRIGDYVGGYEDWVRQCRKLDRSSQTALPMEEKIIQAATPNKKSRPPMGRKEREELDALPARIEEMERQHSEWIARMGNPELYRTEPESLKTLQTEIEALEKAMDEALSRWETLEARRMEVADRTATSS